MSDAPKRMLEELEGGPLRSALEAGVKELPSEQSLASLAAKLGLGAAAVGAAAVASGAASAGASGAASGAGAGAGVGTAAGVSGATAGGTAVAGVKIVTVVKLALALAVVGGGTAGVYTATRAPAEGKQGAPVGLVAAPPAAAARASASEGTSASLAPPDPFASAAPSATPPPRPASSAPATPASDPVEEARLLGRAQGALERDPAAALSAASEHATRYPRGALAQEREVLAIDALLRLGRRKEAEARARAFRTAYPTSGHLVRLEALLAKP